MKNLMKVMVSGMFAVFLVSCWGQTQEKPEPISKDSVSRGRGEKRDTVSCSPDKNAEKDTMFCMLGRGLDRKENFHLCPIEVTTDNVKELYRKYNVEQIEGCDLYVVNPFKYYENSQYFTRLLRFEEGKQVAGVTFYGWNARYVFLQDNNRYMVGLNSIPTTAGFNTSTFTCKSVLLDRSLNIINEREFRYPEQGGCYDYAYFDTIIPRKDGYDFKVINIGFDTSDYFEYKGHLSKDNVVTESSKKKIEIYL